jgi:hypothetical protein
MGGKTSQSSQTVQIPPEVLARYNAVNARAENAASTPFERYSNDPSAFVAQLTGAQRAGISQVQDSSQLADPYFQQAGAYGQNAAQAVNPADLGEQQINKYMNPYMQNVLGSTQAMLNQQNQQAMAGQTGNAIRSGAFGGDRAGIAAANLAQQQNLAAGKIYSDIASQGYNQALQTAAQQQGLGYQASAANRAAQLAASQNLANIGSGRQAAALQGAQALMGAGQLEQQTEQAGKTALFNQFQQEKSYPFQVAQFLANIAEGTGALSGSTTTTTQPGGFFSDERLKEDVHVIGKTFDGQPIYKYRYKGEPRHQIGLIAQDVEKHHPHAVGLAAGYKTVDYDKATKAAEHKGHFASGGLAGESMGGHVAPEHMGEGYADGGSPALQGLSPSDFAEILQAQAKMFGPFSEAGMDISGSPEGGSSYVPSANLPVASLVVPSMDVATPESGLEQAAAAAEAVGTLGKTGTDAYGYGSKKYQEWKKNHPSSDVSETPMGEESFASGGLAGYAMGGFPDEQKNPSQVGIFDSAAQAPNQEDKGKLNIPTEQTAPKELQTPGGGGASAKDPSMEQASQLASIVAAAATAASMFSDKRLKQDVQPIGKTFDGQIVYKYRYKGEPHFRMGLIAQEVEKHHPHAVGLAGGYKTVNYDKATEAAEHRGHFAQGGLPPVTPFAAGLPKTTLGGFASGGMPYGGGGLNIPTEGGQQHQLLTAGAPPPAQSSGLSQLDDVASLAQTGMDVGKGFSSSGPKEVDVQKLSSTSSPESSAANSKLNDILSGGITMANGGLAGRHGYAWGGADDSDEFLSQPRFKKDFWLQNESRAENYPDAQEQKQAALKQRDEDINRQLKLYEGPAIEGEDPNAAPFYTVGSDNKAIYHPPLSAEGEDINKGLTFGDESGRKFTLGEGNKRQYVSGGTGSGLAAASAPERAVDEGMSDAEFQAMLNKLDSGNVDKSYTMSEPSPVAEALGDVSQMETTTPAGATGSGGLSPKDAPNVAPVAAAAAPAKAEAAPTAGLAGAKPAAKAATTEDGKPAHWYTDPKNIIPLLQGIAAMGTTPTRSWGVALASGLGQGLKGYQQQRQFEIDKKAKEAEIKQTGAYTRNIDIETAAAAAKNIGNSKFEFNEMQYVILENGQYMPAYIWQNLPADKQPPLLGTSVATGTGHMPDLFTAPVPKAPAEPVSTAPAATPTAPAGAVSPSAAAYNAIEKNSIANMSSGAEALKGYTQNTVEGRQAMADRASASFAQEPQLFSMSAAVSKIPENSVLSGNTYGNFLRGVTLNWNSFVRSVGHPELEFGDETLTEAAIRDKAAAAAQLQLGGNSVEALRTAAAAIPAGEMTKEASIAITANMLLDKQRAIDEAAYENDVYGHLKNKIGYDVNESRNQFRQETAARYADEKNKLTQLLNAVTPDGQAIVGLLLSGRTTPQAVDKYMNSPGISRYFISGNR